MLVINPSLLLSNEGWLFRLFLIFSGFALIKMTKKLVWLPEKHFFIYITLSIMHWVAVKKKGLSQNVKGSRIHSHWQVILPFLMLIYLGSQEFVTFQSSWNFLGPIKSISGDCRDKYGGEQGREITKEEQAMKISEIQRNEN